MTVSGSKGGGGGGGKGKIVIPTADTNGTKAGIVQFHGDEGGSVPNRLRSAAAACMCL